MSDIQANSNDYGASEIMGPLLRTFVEQQLIEDLTHYKVFSKDLHFNWSNSCGEGHSTDYLDGVLENFSYISVLDKNNLLIAEGWLEFVESSFDKTADKTVFVYWDFVTTYEGYNRLVDKSEPGIPDHIWQTLDETLKDIYKSNKQRKRTIGLP